MRFGLLVGAVARAEEVKRVDIYLGHTAHYLIFVLILARADFPLDIELRTLADVTFGKLCIAPEHDDVVPLGALRHLRAVCEFVTALACRQRKRSDGTPRLAVAHVRVSADVTDKYCFVY